MKIENCNYCGSDDWCLSYWIARAEIKCNKCGNKVKKEYKMDRENLKDILYPCTKVIDDWNNGLGDKTEI